MTKKPTKGKTRKPLNGPSIVGFTGLKRSGKDTAAAELGNYGYEPVQFAGALKGMIRYLLGYAGMEPYEIERYVDGDLKEEPCEELNGQTVRHAMQTLGTEWGRNLIHPDIWTNIAMRRASQNKMTVVSDIRFPNEVKAINDAGGKVIRITRNSNENTDTHPSETFVEGLKVDGELSNDTTVEEFKQRIREIVGSV